MVKKQTVTARDGVFRLHLDHPPTQDELAAEARLRRFGTPAGSRGIGSLVWWPAGGTSVRVSTFQVKWNPPVAPDFFAVSLTSETNEVLWSAEQVDSAQAGLSTAQDSAIKAILLARQNDVKPERLTLTVTSEAQGALATEFTLLSKQEEANVDGKLQVAELEDDSILRIVNRADTLRSADLLCELAGEYDAALKILPGSESLLQSALIADRTVGYLARTRELESELKQFL